MDVLPDDCVRQLYWNLYRTDLVNFALCSCKYYRLLKDYRQYLQANGYKLRELYSFVPASIALSNAQIIALITIHYSIVIDTFAERRFLETSEVSDPQRLRRETISIVPVRSKYVHKKVCVQCYNFNDFDEPEVLDYDSLSEAAKLPGLPTGTSIINATE